MALTTSKYIGACSKCNLILCEKDKQEAGNAPICPRCSNHAEPVEYTSVGYKA